jgi:predicted adenine nucleotide alpha hydrolase (AANH) superfamily ATPase
MEGPYDCLNWAKATEKFKNEPEKGRRCDVCYALRLKKTAEKASRLGFDSFTTVMSLSPWKKAETMNKIGSLFARRSGLDFLEANFKKQNGFRKSVDLSREKGLYRQNYCGCIYSMK